MSDIRIEAFHGSYDTDAAYNRVIGYISNKTYFGGYGFFCSTDIPIIEQFRLSETYSNHVNVQKMWHFIITFSEQWQHTELLYLANQAALLFSSEYQIIYGLDIDKGNPHLHFGVNAFSYHPASPILSPELMQGRLGCLQQLLSQWYPHRTVTLQFQGKKG